MFIIKNTKQDDSRWTESFLLKVLEIFGQKKKNNRNMTLAEPTIIANFKSADGISAGPSLNLPVNVTPEQLEMILNQILSNVFSLIINQENRRKDCRILFKWRTRKS